MAVKLGAVDLFEGLNDEELEALHKAGSTNEYAKNAVIIREGDLGDSFFVIDKGRVKVYCSDHNGKDFILQVLGEGDYFGELALLEGDLRTASVRALEKSKLMVIREQDFSRVIETHPNIARLLARNLARKVRKLTGEVKSLALDDVYSRVAKVLLELAERDEDGVMRIQEKLTQQDLADRVGASREMVARILKDLATGGYIAVESRQICLLKHLPEHY